MAHKPYHENHKMQAVLVAAYRLWAQRATDAWDWFVPMELGFAGSMRPKNVGQRLSYLEKRGYIERRKKATLLDGDMGVARYYYRITPEGRTEAVRLMACAIVERTDAQEA